MPPPPAYFRDGLISWGGRHRRAIDSHGWNWNHQVTNGRNILNSGEGIYRNYPKMYGYDVMVPWFYNSQLFGEMLWSSRDDGIMAVQGPLFWCLWYHHPPMGSLMAPFPMWHPLGLGMYILDCMYVHIYDKLHLNRWIYIQSQHKESSTYTKLTWLQYDLNPPNGHASTIAFFCDTCCH